jgi:hypothetical protein
MRRSAIASVGFSLIALYSGAAAGSIKTERHAEPSSVRDQRGVRVSASDIASGHLPSRILLTLGGKVRAMKLVDANLFSSDAKILYVGSDNVVQRPVPRTYWGEIEGVPLSNVYLTVSSIGVTGIVQAEDGTWDVEPARRFDSNANLPEVVAYRNDGEQEYDLSDDVPTEPEILKRGASSALLSGSLMTASTLKGFRVYTLVSYEYMVNSAGGDPDVATSRVATQLAFARMWMQRDLLLSMKSTDIVVYTSAAADIFVQSPQTYILNRLQAFRTNEQPTTKPTAITHLYYGGSRNWTSSSGFTDGIGNLGLVCGDNITTNVALSARRNDVSIVGGANKSAHEIGHNLGADHPHLAKCNFDESHTTCGNLRIPRISCHGGPRDGQSCETNSINDCCAVIGACTLQELSGSISCLQPNPQPVMWFTGPPPGYTYSTLYDDCAKCFIRDVVTSKTFHPDITGTSNCFYGIKCGDVDSGGTITTFDAQLALNLATCSPSCAYNGLADVAEPIGAPGGIDSLDALNILQIASGLHLPPATCGAF